MPATAPTRDTTPVQNCNEIRRLRRAVRFLTLVVVALPALAAALALGTTRIGTIQAERFELLDASGRVIAVLGIEEAETVFTLLDDQGKQRLVLTHGPDQTGMFLLDAEETLRVGTAQFAHGGGGFALHGPESKGAAVLYLKDSGSLTFYGPDGEVLERLAPKTEDTP